jgi:hypothetical protein
MNIEQIFDPHTRFSTCKYRSEEEVEKIIQRCECRGGNYKDKGFFCEKREIFKLTEGICNICQDYESK